MLVDREISGAKLWDYAVAQLGVEAVEAKLQEFGYDGLYYDHGGEGMPGACGRTTSSWAPKLTNAEQAQQD